MVKNWSKERERMESGLRTYQPFSIASYWQGWERERKRKPFNWPMQSHVSFVNKYPALLKWGLWSRKERNSAICCSNYSLCQRLVKKRKSMSRQSVCHVCLLDLRSCLLGRRSRPKVQATSIKRTSCGRLRTLDLRNGSLKNGFMTDWSWDLRFATMLKLQTSRSTL